MKDEITRKIEDLMKRHKAAVQRKAQLSGQLSAKKEELKKLMDEIREAGFNPETLAEDLAKAEQDLLAEIEAFEKDLVRVEEAIRVYDNVEK